MVFKLHLTNKLLRRGMTPNEAMSFLYEHTLKYHPLLDELFKELLSESPYGGFPVLLNRNPSLKRGSIQMMRVTKIKTDPQINTISMSVLALKAPNADFDGDQLNGMLILDLETAKRLERLQPHHNVLDLQKPRALSRDIALPAPVLATISNWLYEDR